MRETTKYNQIWKDFQHLPSLNSSSCWCESVFLANFSFQRTSFLLLYRNISGPVSTAPLKRQVMHHLITFPLKYSDFFTFWSANWRISIFWATGKCFTVTRLEAFGLPISKSGPKSYQPYNTWWEKEKIWLQKPKVVEKFAKVQRSDSMRKPKQMLPAWGQRQGGRGSFRV